MKIKVKFADDGMGPVMQAHPGEWFDLRAAADVELKAGEFAIIPLGVAMELPAGYEAIVAPRSSTFKRFGILLTNGIGVIDSAYCGDNDWWTFPALAMRDTRIAKNDRIAQFRIQPVQGQIELEEVQTLGNESRGGLGSTGTR